MTNNQRVKPLELDQLDERQRGVVKPFIGKDGSIPNIFGTLCHHMDLLEAWENFGNYTMFGSQVDKVLRELAILRAALNIDCEYEWHHHERIARSLGVTEEQLECIRQGEPLDTPEQNLMIQCADDLAGQSMLSDETWSAMSEKFGLNYTLDVVFTIGAYMTLGMGLKSCGVQIEGRRSSV